MDSISYIQLQAGFSFQHAATSWILFPAYSYRLDSLSSLLRQVHPVNSYIRASRRRREGKKEEKKEEEEDGDDADGDGDDEVEAKEE